MPDHGPDLFAGAAPHYVAHRPPYSPELFPLLARRLGLSASAAVLDLGCGPGTLTLPLAAHCGRVIGVDPGPEMLEVARERVAEAGLDNVELVAALAERLPDWIGGLRAAVMGRSFHWMDREAVLAELDRRIEPGGGVALVRTTSGNRAPWQQAVEPVIARFLGARARRDARDRSNRDHLAVIVRSPFPAVEAIDLPPVEHRWTVDSAAGYLYSVSHSAPHLFGDRLDAYDAELRAALAAALPAEGLPAEVVTSVLIARRSAA